MPRYIDADKLRKDILDLPNCYNGFSDAYDKAYIIDVIDEQQTVVAKVLRCKDCRWYENDGFHTNCKIMQFCVEAEDYCSRWERREDAEEE